MIINYFLLIPLEIIKHKYKSSPENVLTRIKKYIDEVWLVIDKDTWADNILQQVYDNCRSQKFNLAVSNPCFYYWLLLHFEDAIKVNHSGACIERIMKYLPNFRKNHIEIEKFRPNIKEAIRRAKEKDNPPCKTWPTLFGTTVYRLVEKLSKKYLSSPHFPLQFSQAFLDKKNTFC